MKHDTHHLAHNKVYWFFIISSAVVDLCARILCQTCCMGANWRHFHIHKHTNPYHYAPMCTKFWSVAFWFVSVFFLFVRSLYVSVPLSLRKAYLCVIHTCAWTFYVFAFGVTRSYNGFSGDCWKFLSGLKFICKKSYRSWMIHSFGMMKTIYISQKLIKTSSECNIFQLLYKFRPLKNLVS